MCVIDRESILSHKFCKVIILISDVIYMGGQVSRGDYYHHLVPRLRMPGAVHPPPPPHTCQLRGEGAEGQFFLHILQQKRTKCRPKDTSLHFSKYTGLKYTSAGKKCVEYIYFYHLY
jgi:hypothetical protein